eukprot:6307012-Amphidinium_carterae.1
MVASYETLISTQSNLPARCDAGAANGGCEFQGLCKAEGNPTVSAVQNVGQPPLPKLIMVAVSVQKHHSKIKGVVNESRVQLSEPLTSLSRVTLRNQRCFQKATKEGPPEGCTYSVPLGGDLDVEDF